MIVSILMLHLSLTEPLEPVEGDSCVLLLCFCHSLSTCFLLMRWTCVWWSWKASWYIAKLKESKVQKICIWYSAIKKKTGKIMYILAYFFTRKFCKDSPQEYRKWSPTVDRQITNRNKGGSEIFIPISFFTELFWIIWMS